MDSSVLHDLRRETKIDTCDTTCESFQVLVEVVSCESFHKHNTILCVVSLACVSLHLRCRACQGSAAVAAQVGDCYKSLS